jgi:hypothetical protein
LLNPLKQSENFTEFAALNWEEAEGRRIFRQAASARGSLSFLVRRSSSGPPLRWFVCQQQQTHPEASAPASRLGRKSGCPKKWRAHMCEGQVGPPIIPCLPPHLPVGKCLRSALQETGIRRRLLDTKSLRFRLNFRRGEPPALRSVLWLSPASLLLAESVRPIS